eukprot:154320-Chlamydomonas_euryale.AAC.3
MGMGKVGKYHTLAVRMRRRRSGEGRIHTRPHLHSVSWDKIHTCPYLHSVSWDKKIVSTTVHTSTQYHGTRRPHSHLSTLPLNIMGQEDRIHTWPPPARCACPPLPPGLAATPAVRAP